MAAVAVTTFNDLLADLAEKLGETTTNSDDNRKRKLNNAYQFIANRDLWWWLEYSSTDTTTTALYYTLPTSFRAFHPLNPVKIGSDWRVMIPFTDLQLHNGSSAVVSLPSVSNKKRAYIYGSSIYFVQDSMTAGQTITYYYYRNVTLLDGNSDEPLMPVAFREMISLYAAGMHLKAQGGPDAAEGLEYLELFDSYMQQMTQEQDNRRTMGIMRRAKDPEEMLIWDR